MWNLQGEQVGSFMGESGGVVGFVDLRFDSESVKGF